MSIDRVARRGNESTGLPGKPTCSEPDPPSLLTSVAPPPWFPRILELLAETKIGHLQAGPTVIVHLHENVVWLEVAMDDA